MRFGRLVSSDRLHFPVASSSGGLMARLLRTCGSQVAANLWARLAALGALTVATLLVARTGGAAYVGNLALLRVLPWFVGIAVSGGLPVGLTYFLSGAERGNRRLPSTLTAIGIGAGLVGTLLWVAGSPVIHALFFSNLPVQLVLLAACTVATQLWVSTIKACAQGYDDLMGSNIIIVLEELAYIPAYVALLSLGAATALVAGILLANVATVAVGALRLARRGFWQSSLAPSIRLAGRVYWFSIRGQLGNVMTLLNLRLDFALVGVLAGPISLGTYAVASKYAELLRLIPVAMNWVLYPRFGRMEQSRARSEAVRLVVPAGMVTVLGAIPLAAAAGFAFPFFYGSAFAASTLPARILLLGLACEGIGGVVMAYLYGSGRPGLSSLAASTGLIVTVALDLVLIPRLGSTGAAIASSAAYLTATSFLLLFFLRVIRSDRVGRPHPRWPASPGKRLLDVCLALSGTILLSPVLGLAAIGIKVSSRGPVLYRAVRVGIDGRPFTMYKLRTMRPHGVGPVITSCDDPRVFFLGRWLRRLKIDELPQLVNVLKGDMSVVGPRPEDPEIVQRYYGPAQLETLTVLPGLASPGSIYGSTHGEPLLLGVDSERLYVEQVLPLKLALELVYVRRASLSYDLLIVARTFAVLFGLIVGRRDFGRPPEIRQVMELAASEGIGPSAKAAGVSGLAINAVRVSGDGAVVED